GCQAEALVGGAPSPVRCCGGEMALNETAIPAAMYAALAARDFEAASQQVAPNVVLSNMAMGDEYQGRQGFLEFTRGLATAFPDMRFSNLVITGSGEHFVAEYELE